MVIEWSQELAQRTPTAAAGIDDRLNSVAVPDGQGLAD
jgi:hypothetical protein